MRRRRRRYSINKTWQWISFGLKVLGWTQSSNRIHYCYSKEINKNKEVYIRNDYAHISNIGKEGKQTTETCFESQLQILRKYCLRIILQCNMNTKSPMKWLKRFESLPYSTILKNLFLILATRTTFEVKILTRPF